MPSAWDITQTEASAAVKNTNTLIKFGFDESLLSDPVLSSDGTSPEVLHSATRGGSLRGDIGSTIEAPFCALF